MNSLVGTIFQSGNIEFREDDNGWVFEKIRAAKKSVPNVAFDPSRVSIDLQLSANVAPEDCPWLERITTQLKTADKVYLKPDNGTLRLSQAKHELGQQKQLILLASQKDADEFAERRWNNIKYLFANRMDDFRFSIGTMVTARNLDEQAERVELRTHLLSAEEGGMPTVYFNATGSEAPVQVVEWRKTATNDRACRFAPENSRIELLVDLARQPITFLHEFREEFKNHAFIFEGDALEASLKKVAAASA